MTSLMDTKGFLVSYFCYITGTAGASIFVNFTFIAATGYFLTS